jgi:hypothetical protein
MNMRKLGCSTALALLASFALASTASAADTWYAAPDPIGTGNECTEIAPCEARYAVEEKPAAGDTVIFAGGDYNISYFLNVVQDVSVEGAKTGTPTRLIGVAGAYTTLWITASAGTGHHVTDLTISNSEDGGNALYVGDYSAGGLLVDRIHATATGPNGYGINAQRRVTGTAPTIVRNSVGWATGSGGTGIRATGPVNSPGSVELHNVVATATAADGYGASFIGDGQFMIGCGNFNGVFKNSIARAALADNDLRVAGAIVPAPCPVNVNSTNSVWRDATTANGATITSAGDLPNMVPLFVDAAAGDFHPAAGSPVVNAGADDADAGSLDLDRNPRVLESAIDIGPYETLEVIPPIIPPTIPGAPAVPADPAPIVSALKFAPVAFLPKPLETPSAAAKKPKGSTVSFNSTEAATLSFIVEAKVSGRKKGKSCSRTAKRGKKCTTYKAVKGSFSIAARVGANSFKFTGYLNSKPLKAGPYRLVGTPKDATGNTGGAVKAPFKILKR